MLVESFSGIRGIYNKDLNLEIIRKYAMAFYETIKQENEEIKIVIGTDTRPSAEAIKKEFIRIFTNNNADVIDVGINPTPAIENAVRIYNADGGIIITASHNPPEYNGFKFLNKTGALIEPEKTKELIKKAHETETIEKLTGDFRKVSNLHNDCIDQYLNFMFTIIGEKNIELIKKFKIKFLLDPNGGSACAIIPKLIEKLNLNAEIINKKPGVFNREIEPNQKSLNYLTQIIKKENFHFAAAFDCDADRIEFVLDNKVIPGHYTLALVVDDFLSELKDPAKQPIVISDATSGIVKETALEHKAKVKEVGVGEINVVREMEKNNSLLGGEGTCGGVIISPSKCRDGILTLILMLKIMAKTNKRLKDLVDSLPKYFTISAKVICDPEKHHEIRRKLKEIFERQKYQIQETEKQGGLKIYFSDRAWLYFRASKTEPGVYRIIADSPYEEESKRLLREGTFVINQIEKQI